MTSPPRRVYVHIGLPKTGTTSLQTLMWHNREALAADGLLYPGTDDGAHHRAAIDVHEGRYGKWKEPGVPGSWEWLVEQLRAWEGTSVFSTELLAPASPAEAAEVLSKLTFAEVHVVCTARDLARQIPSVWQENIKTRHPTSFDDFLAALRSPELTLRSQLFWDFQELTRVLRTWGKDLPPERVHVVTVPPRGGSGTVVWERFASVLGIAPDRYDLDVPQHNFSLGVPETEFLRRVNIAIGDEFPWPRYTRLVKLRLAEQVLAKRDGSSRIQLPAADLGWVREKAVHFTEEIKAAGYHVVGDLDDLVPAEPTGDEPEHPVSPSDAELLDVAIDALATYIVGTPPPPPPPRPKSVKQLGITLRQMSERSPKAMAARRAYWRARSALRKGR